VGRSCQRLWIHLILDRVGILDGFSLYIFLPLLKKLDGVGVARWAVSLLEEAIDKALEREVLAYL
jgi:hypothetical protein